VPKVARFNAYLRDNPEAFEGMTLWRWQDDERSLDYAVQPISSEMIRHRTFVFLGDRMALDEIDPHAALGAFDRLFPLYAFVEAGSAIPAGEDETTETAAVEALDTLDLYGGREIDGGRWIKATRRARTLDIFLRHREIQRRLKEKLIGEGMTDVRLEVPIGDRLIDAVVQHEGELWFYEAALLIRKKIAQGIDPVAERQVTPTFRKAAEMVHEEHQKAWKNGKYLDQWIATLKSYAFPKMDDRLVSEIEGPRIRDVLAPIWLTKPQTARRVRQRIGSLEHQWGQGRELLTDNSILVVDEAGMICTRQRER
ncbi:hypothetical protein LTR94_026027, partial [Friedmanniomyces endolithicus]